MRYIVLDTETTGLRVKEGHRVIEIGCVTLVDRKLNGEQFHRYINPQRGCDPEALKVHGLEESFLSTQPLFKEIIDEFLAFVKGACLIIHNAPFDIAFLNRELQLAGNYGAIKDYCTVLDTLVEARLLHGGQGNSLDDLCKRYKVDNSRRDLHGALVGVHLLAQVYLRMTSRQNSLWGDDNPLVSQINAVPSLASKPSQGCSPVIYATDTELVAHKAQLAAIEKTTGYCLWQVEEHEH
jgi:DNA polymerase-3 subunit epsilon